MTIDRQRVVNMKAKPKGYVVMAQFAITFPLPGSWIPGTPSRPTVVLKRKSCMQNISILCKATNINKLRTYNIWQ